MGGKVMSTLVIDSPQLEMRPSPGGLGLYRGGALVSQVPLRLLDRVILHGARTIDSGVLARILSAGASVVLISGRQNRFIGTISGELHSDASIRLGQYRLCTEQNASAQWSRRLILLKLRAQHASLSRILADRPDLRHPFLQPMLRLVAARKSLALVESIDRASLLGIEGAAARSYFEALASALPESISFAGRVRRPPRDPVNACLSLAYTLLLSEASFAAHGAGLDPALGFFHSPAFGRPSLACDLMEPLRPAADVWVWSLFRSHRLRAEDFRNDTTGCRLGKAGRARFYAAFEEFAAPVQRHLRRYVAMMVRAIRALPGTEFQGRDEDSLPFPLDDRHSDTTMGDSMAGKAEQ